MRYDKQIMTEHLPRLCEAFRNRKITCVTTNGVFDLFGAHHLAFLQMAKKLADVLIVGVNSDESTRRIKGPDRPIIGEVNRVAILEGLECVNHVYLFGEDTPCEWLDLLKPTFHVKDDSYRGACPEESIVIGNGGTMVYLPCVSGESTTDLIRRIKGCEPLT